MLILTNKRISSLFLAFTLIYLAQTVYTKPDKVALAKYHITADQSLALIFTIALPFIIIWAIALVGYLRLKAYTHSIQDSKDGVGFAQICQGIMLLALWLPFSAVLSNMVTHVYQLNPGAAATMVRINNYGNLLILIPAFWLVKRGSDKLVQLVKRPVSQLPQLLVILSIAFAALYTFLVLNDPARQTPTHGVVVASYYLSDWLTTLTIIIPRLVMWFWGVYAVYNLYLYRRTVKGTLYKSALKSLAWGLSWVVAACIVLRIFQSLSTQLSSLGLGLILLLIYILVILIGIGFVMVARGAKKLLLIEQV